MPSTLLQMAPLSNRTEGPQNNLNRAQFEIDQVRGQSYLERPPTADPERYLTHRTRQMTLQDQQTFLNVGNNALVSQFLKN